MYLLFILPPVAFLLVLIVGFFISAPGYKGPESDNYNGRVYQNYHQIKAKGFLDVIKWIFTRKNEEWKTIQNFSTTKPANTQEDILIIYFVN